MEDNEVYSVQKKHISKIEDDSLYQANYNKPVSSVPISDLRILLKLFFDKAAVNMGKDSYDAPEAAIDSICEFIIKDYAILPIMNIGSVILKGSLGTYGPGRLVPATVYRWLREGMMEYQRIQRHNELKTHETVTGIDLVAYPVGSAMVKKLLWYKEGVINMDDWDRLPLKEIAERIAQKLEVVPELWGVKSKPKIKKFGL